MHNDAAPLTVAIPTYNGTAHLSETLHSILSQECEPFDLLVCDDHSDDETVSLVRALAGERARIVVNDLRLGLAGNWNQCMALSRTPWVNIFHQDDVMLPGNLSWVLEKIQKIEREKLTVGLIAGPVRVIDEHSQPVAPSVVDPGGNIVMGVMPDSPEFVDFPPGDFCDWLRESNLLRCSAVITNRTAHAEVGGFDASYRYVIDWEFWHRVSRTWGVSWKLYDPTVLVRWHAASETHRFKTGTDDLDETVRLVDDMFGHAEQNSPHAAMERRLASRSLSRAFLNRSYDALRSGRTELARICLGRAWCLSSREAMKTLATDPRLCTQMVTLAVWPRLARRWFTRTGQG